MRVCGIGWAAMAAFVGVVSFGAMRASAQTDPVDLLVAPMMHGGTFESQTDAILENAGHVRENSLGIRLDSYETQGRWELTSQYPINPTFGYDVYDLNIDSRDPRLPHNLTDTSVAFGSPIWRSGDWFVAASAGIGYQGNAPFGQSNAYYGKATVLAGRDLGNKSNLVFGIDYDGGRADFPDVPIPGFAYTKQINDTLTAVIGFPYTKIDWKPNKAFDLELSYTFPTFGAKATYKLSEQWGLYAKFMDRQQAFHEDGLPPDQRLIYRQQRAETGVRWDATQHVTLQAGIGYAFDTKFDTGFDARDPETLLHASDEGYIRLSLQVGW